MPIDLTLKLLEEKILKLENKATQYQNKLNETQTLKKVLIIEKQFLELNHI